jgi:hypothetical protein
MHILVFCCAAMAASLGAKHFYATELNGKPQKLARDRLLELNASPA